MKGCANLKEYKLFMKETCPYCKKVLRFIDKYNLDEIELVDIKKEEGAEEYLIEKGGQDMVPCLFIDGEPMYESSDIIKYLKEEFL